MSHLDCQDIVDDIEVRDEIIGIFTGERDSGKIRTTCVQREMLVDAVLVSSQFVGVG